MFSFITGESSDTSLDVLCNFTSIKLITDSGVLTNEKSIYCFCNCNVYGCRFCNGC
ncbi:hypothetical protein ECB41_A0190 [Escherichia coli B41]|nr:hypothetical protein ECB41_A0190 [Escherichia coli B41]